MEYYSPAFNKHTKIVKELKTESNPPIVFCPIGTLAEYMFVERCIGAVQVQLRFQTVEIA